MSIDEKQTTVEAFARGRGRSMRVAMTLHIVDSEGAPVENGLLFASGVREVTA
jgi:hypothetical protein